MNNKETLERDLANYFHAHNQLNPLVNTGCIVIPLAYSGPFVTSVFRKVVEELGYKIQHVGFDEKFSDCSASVMMTYHVYAE